ncbi:mycofactocin biosynthesis chaperone MftB [Thermodesulfobacteriota bacterium]
MTDPGHEEGSALKKGKRYILAPGTEVREEDFGLLFYTMKGPRLFFLKCGRLLEPGFFRGEMSLSQWLARLSLIESQALSLKNTLTRLKAKGVILEC